MWYNDAALVMIWLKDESITSDDWPLRSGNVKLSITASSLRLLTGSFKG